MSDDLLRQAADALREETRDADDGARFTRARVMASLQQREHRRRTRLALLVPLAACFAAATAWGTVSGRAATWVSSVSQALGIEVTAPPKPSSKPAVKRGPKQPAPEKSSAPPALEVPPPATTEVEASEPAPSPESVAPREPAPVRQPAPKPERSRNDSPAPAPSVSPAPPSEEGPRSNGLDISDRAHELYRVAHRSHFVDHDYASALRAWDAYLSEAPGGRFVLEARYNRALCLVRLGQTDAARAALTPFADGKFGAYRQNEARALLDALAK